MPCPPSFSRLAVAACAALLACSEAPTRRPNVLLIVIDTLRADRLGCLGNARGLTPALDELAGEGVLFERAFSHAPWTLPSTASLLTGLHPKEHGAGGRLDVGFHPLAAGVPTLPGLFAARGYATHAVVNVPFLGETFEVTRDFAQVDLYAQESNVDMRRAEATTDAALQWLRGRADEPCFLMVHYFDPHAVYDPPQPFRRRFAADVDQGDDGLVFGTREHMLAHRAGRLLLSDEDLRRIEMLYDGEVAYTDAQVERLLDGVDALGLGDDTIVVVTSDHGEEFGDHGDFEHGHTLYDELCHVPLLVKAPGLKPGVVPQVVRHVDLFPTICELADLGPARGLAGSSLLPLARGEEDADRVVLAHGNMWGAALTALREERFKLIRGAPDGDELYDWRADPGETLDLVAEEAARARELRARLAAAEAALSVLRSAPAELSKEQQELLRGMGYVGEGPVGSGQGED